jgi:hypothetical protein
VVYNRVWLTGCLLVTTTILGFLTYAPSSDGLNTGVRPLTLYQKHLPPIGVSFIHASGQYPQMAGSPSSKVNRELRNLALREESGFRVAALRSKAFISAKARQIHPGGFRISTVPRLLGASTSTLSVLLPVTAFIPLGVVQEYWISLTMRMPSGAPVALRDLFAQPTVGLRLLGKAAKRVLLDRNRCVRESRANGAARLASNRGFEPALIEDDAFALTPTGITIGFAEGGVASPSCGRLDVTVPYESVTPYASFLGLQLVSGTRRARID